MKLRFVMRLWYYFRMGYGTYLTFILGYVSTLITVYYLAIRNLPDLLILFPHFQTFAILATVIGVPLSVVIGWLHLKRSPAYSSELDIVVEANPYYFKSPPGYYQEVFFPVFRELLVSLVDKNDPDVSRQTRIALILKKVDILIEGGSVGHPRRHL